MDILWNYSRKFRNADVENQEPSGNRSQKDPHPEAEFFACCARNLTDLDPDEASHRTGKWRRWRRWTGKIAALKALNRKTSGINGVLPDE